MYTDILLDIAAAGSLLRALAVKNFSDAQLVAISSNANGDASLPGRVCVAAAELGADVALVDVVATGRPGWDGGRDGGKSDDESLEHFEGWGWLVGFEGKVVVVEVLDWSVSECGRR